MMHPLRPRRNAPAGTPVAFSLRPLLPPFLNAVVRPPQAHHLGPAQLREELARVEMALERAASSANTAAAMQVVAALEREREELLERLRQMARR
jgi:hypothetical protein